MNHPNDRKYAKTHEWAKIDDGTAVVGISFHAQDALGDITFVELPKQGTQVKQGKEFGVVESVKAASDLYAPLSGEITEVNSNLLTQPELLNKDPHNQGWIIKLKIANRNEFNNLLDADKYEEYLQSES